MLIDIQTKGHENPDAERPRDDDKDVGPSQTQKVIVVVGTTGLEATDDHGGHETAKQTQDHDEGQKDQPRPVPRQHQRVRVDVHLLWWF